MVSYAPLFKIVDFNGAYCLRETILCFAQRWKKKAAHACCYCLGCHTAGFPAVQPEIIRVTILFYTYVEGNHEQA